MTEQKTRYTWIYSASRLQSFPPLATRFRGSRDRKAKKKKIAFQKLLQTRQTSRNYQKQVLVMIKHCLGISQINSIPAWSKEFSYIAFLYRTLAKV